MPTISNSRLACSKAARMTKRPMRPNPLIATLMAMVLRSSKNRVVSLEAMTTPSQARRSCGRVSLAAGSHADPPLRPPPPLPRRVPLDQPRRVAAEPDARCAMTQDSVALAVAPFGKKSAERFVARQAHLVRMEEPVAHRRVEARQAVIFAGDKANALEHRGI